MTAVIEPKEKNRKKQKDNEKENKNWQRNSVIFQSMRMKRNENQNEFNGMTATYFVLYPSVEFSHCIFLFIY